MPLDRKDQILHLCKYFQELHKEYPENKTINEYYILMNNLRDSIKGEKNDWNQNHHRILWQIWK